MDFNIESRFTQKFLVGIFSHRFHTQKLWCFQGGALVSARLCRLPEQEVHQHNKIYILPQNSEHILAGIFSHRFHRFTQNFLAEKNSVKSVDSVGSIHTLTSVRICEICGSFFNYKLRVKSVGVFSTTNLEWILWEFFNYKLQTSECYRKLGTTLQRRGNDITGAR